MRTSSRALSLLTAAALSLTACSDEERPSAPVSPELQEQRELASLADGLRAAIDDNIGECSAMGAAMAEWHGTHGARFDELRAKHAKLPGDEWARWNRMLGAKGRAETCVGNPMIGMDDPEVKRVLGALGL